MSEYWEFGSQEHAARLERTANPISMTELERRWKAVRDEMERRGIDVLLMQNANEKLGGYVKYFTDLPAKMGYPESLIFPKNDRMTAVRHGPVGGNVEYPAGGDPIQRGIRTLLTDPWFPSVDYTKLYMAKLVVKALKARNDRTVGLAGTSSMAAPFLEYVKASLPNAEFVDATEWVDAIKAVKSREEQNFIRRTAAMQDAAFAAVLDAIKPGMRDHEVMSLAYHVSQDLGSEDGIYLGSSAPLGQPTGILRRRHFQGRQIQAGDYFTILIENNGPGGFYTELGRTIVLGKAPQALKDELDLILAAQQNTLKRLRPGALCRDIYKAHCDYMKSVDRPGEQRLYAHGQGYDLVERPLIRDDETMKLEAGMNLAVHPGHATSSFYVWICDNYLVTPDGPSECLHQTPQKIFEV